MVYHITIQTRNPDDAELFRRLAEQLGLMSIQKEVKSKLDAHQIVSDIKAISTAAITEINRAIEKYEDGDGFIHLIKSVRNHNGCDWGLRESKDYVQSII